MLHRRLVPTRKLARFGLMAVGVMLCYAVYQAFIDISQASLHEIDREPYPPKSKGADGVQKQADLVYEKGQGRWPGGTAAAAAANVDDDKGDKNGIFDADAGKEAENNAKTYEDEIDHANVNDAGDGGDDHDGGGEANVNDYDADSHDEYETLTQKSPDATEKVGKALTIASSSPRAYQTAELSKNLMNIGHTGRETVDNVGGAEHTRDNSENNEDFQDPEMGYRYNNLTEQQHRDSDIQVTPVGLSIAATNIMSSNIISEGRSNDSMKTNEAISKNNKKSRYKLTPDKTPGNGKSRFATALPPSPDIFPTSHLPEDAKYLVYLCTPDNLCGGWGDRQRGIMSAYLLARVLDRQFKIIMSTPCELSYFYLPRRVQWRVFGRELFIDSNTTINAFTNPKFRDTILQKDLNLRFPQKVVYLRTNQDYYHLLPKNPFYSKLLSQWGGLHSRRWRFRWAWDDLMQPSPMLLTHLEHVVGTQFLVRKGFIPKPLGDPVRKNNFVRDVGNTTLICAHVRMGKNPTIPMDEEISTMTLQDLPTLLKFMLSKDIKGDANFFVATDYELVRSQAKDFFGERLINYGGKILHIDRQRSERSSCVGFEVALLDQLILSLCDVLVMSMSGFSVNAYYVSNSTGEFYIMENGVIEPIRE